MVDRNYHPLSPSRVITVTFPTTHRSSKQALCTTTLVMAGHLWSTYCMPYADKGFPHIILIESPKVHTLKKNHFLIYLFEKEGER